MASGFPGSIDNFTDPLANSSLASPSHAGQHADLNDAVEKIETYMGLVKVIPTGATNGTVSAAGDVTIGNAVSSVTVSGAFSANYDAYKILVTGGSASTSSVIQLKMGATATGYYFGFMYLNYGSNTVVGEQTTTGTLWTYGGDSSANGLHADITLHNPFLSKRTFIHSNIGSGGGAGYVGQFSGMLNNTTSYTDFVLIPNVGTLTGGTIRVYGYRN